jgi:hypothetical protein
MGTPSLPNHYGDEEDAMATFAHLSSGISVNLDFVLFCEDYPHEDDPAKSYCVTYNHITSTTSAACSVIRRWYGIDREELLAAMGRGDHGHP